MIENWKLRTFVINDFTDGRTTDNKEGTLRYFKPENSIDYSRDTSHDIMSTDQKTIKIKKVEFGMGSHNNIAKCGTVYQSTAYALNVTFIDGTNKDPYELVFDNHMHAEEFIGAIIQIIGPDNCPNLKVSIKITSTGFITIPFKLSFLNIYIL